MASECFDCPYMSGGVCLCPYRTQCVGGRCLLVSYQPYEDEDDEGSEYKEEQ